MLTPRLTIIHILKAVFKKKQSLSAAFNEHLPDDNSFVKQCCFGVCRYYGQLNCISQQLLNKPFKTKDIDIHLSLLLGLYEIIHLSTPDHAAVSETVNLSKTLKKDWARGVLNSCLRRFLREQDALLVTIEKSDIGRYSHPQWLINAIKKSWPEQYQIILDANNSQAPMSLRVNHNKTNRTDYLAAHPIGQDIAGVDSAITLTQAAPVVEIPGFNDGLISVQDVASQCVAPLFTLHTGMHILDACSAPGGKACHLLETQPDIKLTALDCDADRLQRVQQNLDRLHLSATLIAAQAEQTNNWWDNQPFDAILLDAPCSATGVIRRHPDSKWLRQETDIAQFAKTQLTLLKTLWPLLKPGGQFLYTTCSVLKEENSDLIAEFIQHTPTAKEIAIKVPFGHPQKHGWQSLPTMNAQDGFYYCMLSK